MRTEEKIIVINITNVMQTSNIDHSMSAIMSRAFLDVRNGSKSVQRRILYTMPREGLLLNNQFEKYAGVIGEVLAN
jgi:DNA gyrase/topoisomerase IV subunit A